MVSPQARHGETVVADPAWVCALLWLGFPLIGAGARLARRLDPRSGSRHWRGCRGRVRSGSWPRCPRPRATIGAVGEEWGSGLYTRLNISPFQP
jgi:hypothetical protein